jgi:hypothetical protein
MFGCYGEKYCGRITLSYVALKLKVTRTFRALDHISRLPDAQTVSLRVCGPEGVPLSGEGVVDQQKCPRRFRNREQACDAFSINKICPPFLHHIW